MSVGRPETWDRWVVPAGWLIIWPYYKKDWKSEWGWIFNRLYAVPLR